jgi:CBS domain containing-hemolysin-like protein
MSFTQDAMWWAIMLMAVACSALTSGIEMGCYALSRVRLAVRAERSSPAPDRAARILRDELAKPDRLITTLLVANNIFNYIAAIAVTEILANSGYSDWLKAVINVAILTPLLLIGADTIPKEIFRASADRLTYPFAAAVRFVRIVLTCVGIVPTVVLFNRLAERWSGLSSDVESLIEPRQKLATLLKESAAHGVLSEAQTSLVDRVLNLRRTTVRDEMTPWSRVRTIPSHWDTRRASRVLSSLPHAWIPVVDAQGKLVGVVRQIDLHLRTSEPISALLRTPARLSPERGLYDALGDVRAAQAPVGIVEVNGVPSGLVTIKDLIEPLTGELADV